MPPSRKIASNLLWQPQGVVRNPLVTLSPEGRIVAADVCPEPDRIAGTEFYAGVLVPDFPADFRPAFARMLDGALHGGETLPEQLAALVPAPGGVPVVISGIDYAAMRLTARAQIRSLKEG